ncbi:hypothetical protein [Streptomyces sp. NPDC059349]
MAQSSPLCADGVSSVVQRGLEYVDGQVAGDRQPGGVQRVP